MLFAQGQTRDWVAHPAEYGIDVFFGQEEVESAVQDRAFSRCIDLWVIEDLDDGREDPRLVSLNQLWWRVIMNGRLKIEKSLLDCLGGGLMRNLSDGKVDIVSGSNLHIIDVVEKLIPNH